LGKNRQDDYGKIGAKSTPTNTTQAPSKLHLQNAARVRLKYLKRKMRKGELPGSYCQVGGALDLKAAEKVRVDTGCNPPWPRMKSIRGKSPVEGRNITTPARVILVRREKWDRSRRIKPMSIASTRVGNGKKR